MPKKNLRGLGQSAPSTTTASQTPLNIIALIQQHIAYNKPYLTDLTISNLVYGQGQDKGLSFLRNKEVIFVPLSSFERHIHLTDSPLLDKVRAGFPSIKYWSIATLSKWFTIVDKKTYLCGSGSTDDNEGLS
jgi:hypothetical protein